MTIGLFCSAHKLLWRIRAFIFLILENSHHSVDIFINFNLLFLICFLFVFFPIWVIGLFPLHHFGSLFLSTLWKRTKFRLFNSNLYFLCCYLLFFLYNLILILLDFLYPDCNFILVLTWWFFFNYVSANHIEFSGGHALDWLLRWEWLRFSCRNKFFFIQWWVLREFF